jgi:hypothetical protein
VGSQRLQTTFASVPAQGRTHRARLDLLLELGNELALALRLAMHRILKTFDELLESIDPTSERLQLGGRRIGVADRRSRLFSRRRGAAQLPYSGDQPLPLRQTQRRSPRLGSVGRGG